MDQAGGPVEVFRHRQSVNSVCDPETEMSMRYKQKRLFPAVGLTKQISFHDVRLLDRESSSSLLNVTDVSFTLVPIFSSAKFLLISSPAAKRADGEVSSAWHHSRRNSGDGVMEGRRERFMG